jgi:ankyrin repeat protein
LQLLLEKGADVNAVDEMYQTALIRAALAPEDIAMPMVEALLKAGVKVNHVDKHENTALCRAVLNANFKVARRLLEAGADANVIVNSQLVYRGTCGTLLDAVEAALKANQKKLDDVETRLKTRKRNFIRSAAELNRKEAQELLANCQKAFDLLREFGAKRQKELK